MAVVGSILFLPYGIYLLSKKKDKNKKIIATIIAGLLGIGLAAYYLVPLFIEIHYFYYGTTIDHFAPGHFLSLRRYFVEEWFYMINDTGPREHWHIGGIFETTILMIAVGLAIWRYIKNRTIDLITILASVGVIYMVMTLKITEPLYTHIVFLGNIQHPWRMLTGFIIIPPILFALLFENIERKKIFFIIALLIIAFLRFPQIYGKNFTDYPQDSYFTTEYNLHGNAMNTVWMGNERDYPFQNTKGKIIEGKGKITDKQIKNSSRTYQVNAQTDVRLVDYTFYFPGWRAYIDKVETPIQFQDPNYRGVITYNVPAGIHTITLKFVETKIRLFGDAVTLLSIVGLFGIYYINKKYKLL
jgi:hypothetical protein